MFHEELLNIITFQIDFKEVLLDCGNEEDDIADITTSVAIYATINVKGVSISLPNGVEAPLDILMKCGGALIQQLPEFLGTNVVKLTEVDMNVNEGLLKFGIEITLAPEYNTIPGTTICKIPSYLFFLFI